MGDRFVRTSLTPLRTSNVTPKERRVMVSALFPKHQWAVVLRADDEVTWCLAGVERHKQENDSCDNQEEPNKIEFPNMVAEWFASVRI